MSKLVLALLGIPVLVVAYQAWEYHVWFAPERIVQILIDRLHEPALEPYRKLASCHRTMKDGGEKRDLTCTMPTACGREWSFGVSYLGGWGYLTERPDLRELRVSLYKLCPQMISDPKRRAEVEGDILNGTNP